MLAGRYRLTELIGSGGAGRVYRGIQDQLGRQVAVKTLRTDLVDGSKTEFEARFLREAALAGSLSSSFIVTIHDFGHDEATGQAFVIMEYLEGPTLTERLRAGPMSVPEALRIAQDVARGLRHAHGKGVIHRDIKPGNIMLVTDEVGRERPAIVDFGLVRSKRRGEHQEVTTTGVYMGTPAYMAPEQARGEKDLTDRVDIYSLGCMLFRMLTGHLPYSSDNAVTTAVMHIQDPFPPMANKAPDISVPRAVEDLVRAMMSKQAHQRPTAAQLVQRIDSLLDTTAETTLRRHPLPGLEPMESPATPWILGASALGTIGAASFACSGLAVLVIAIAQPGVPTAEVPTPAVDATAEPTAAEPGPEPEPRPTVPAAEPEPEPEPVVTAKPEPEPEAKPQPAPPPERVQIVVPVSAPEPEPVAVVIAKPPDHGALTEAAVTVDGVTFTAPHARRAVLWLNAAEAHQLRDAGVYGRGVAVIEQNRPFRDLQDFAATPGIGEKTIDAVYAATR